MKKFLAILLIAVMMMAMGTVAFAAGTGSITIKNATKGYTYEAYKVFDATYVGDKVSYTTPAANASKLDNTIFGWSTAADANGNISVWKLDTATDKAVTDWIEAHYADFGGTKIDGVFDATNSTVTFSNLDYGYYYIKSGLGATVTIDSATPTATVYDKNEATTVAPAKTIVSVDGVAKTDLKEADAHVGSVVGFKVTAVTNNWIDQDHIRTEFKIEDTPTNMTIDTSSVAVKVNGTAVAADAFTAAVASGKLTVTIPMVDANGNSVYEANHGDAAGQIPVEITYSATIDAAAADSGASNTVGDEIIKVNTYMFKLHKVDEDDADLTGAKFELYKGDTKVKFTKNDDGSYTYNENGTVTEIDLTSSATAIIKGLDNLQDYTLKEIKAPDGYNMTEDKTVAASSLTKAPSDNPTEVKVENKQGAELPSTGGIGTTIFYIVGSILVLGAAVVLVTRRRMNQE